MKKKIAMAILFVLTAVVCLVINFSKNNFKENVKPKKKEREEIVHQVTAFPKTPHVFPCQANTSAYNISEFSSLPGHIKEFLIYRHCRSFPMLLDVPDKCGGPHNSANVFLLLVIKSSPENYDRREVLRKTWAEERLHKGVWIRRVFIIGTTKTGFEKHRLNRLLKLENRENKDILQWDFNDSFFNLTLKQVLFLQWMERMCPQARFLLNGDDDIFANSFNMVEFLQDQEDNDGSKHLFTGFLIVDTGPVRYAQSKYYVPIQIQESPKYPPYCGGGGYLLSGFTARTIFNTSLSITLHPIDDVFMGICLEKAGLKPTSHFGMRTYGMNVPAKNADKLHPCYYREILVVHRFEPHLIYVMWDEIQNPNLQCGKNNLSTHKSI